MQGTFGIKDLRTLRILNGVCVWERKHLGEPSTIVLPTDVCLRLDCIALHWIVLHGNGLHCTVLDCVALYWVVLHCMSVLDCVALYGACRAALVGGVSCYIGFDNQYEPFLSQKFTNDTLHHCPDCTNACRAHFIHFTRLQASSGLWLVHECLHHRLLTRRVVML